MLSQPSLLSPGAGSNLFGLHGRCCRTSLDKPTAAIWCPRLLVSILLWFLEVSGSSYTSPSRLPRITVLYHPRRPNILAFKPGATSVFMRVCPVLKSFPAIGTPRRSASSIMHGKSTLRLGAPLANGTSLIELYRFRSGSAKYSHRLRQAPSNASRVSWIEVAS